MRIEHLHVEGYGVLADRPLDLPAGLVCVKGENESGKSTLLAFVRGILFGFKKALTKQAPGVDKRTAPFDPVAGGRKGGSLVLCVDEGGEAVRYRVQRVKLRSVDGELTVEDLSRGGSWQGAAGERRLARLLGGTDDVVFSNVFAVGLDELHAVSSMEEDEVRSVLFTADAGVGAGFVSEMRRLEERVEGLYKRRGQKPEVNRLLRHREDLTRELREARRDLARYEGDRERLAQWESEEGEAQGQRDERVHEEQRARQRIQAREHLVELRDLQAQAANLQKKKLPDDQAMDKAHALRTRLDTNREEVDRRERQIAQLEEQRENLRFSEKDAQAWQTLRDLPRTHLIDDMNAAGKADRLREEMAALPGPHLDRSDREMVRGLLSERGRFREAVAEKENERIALVTRIDGLRVDVLGDAEAQAAERACRLDLQGLEHKVEAAREAEANAHETVQASLRGLGEAWDEDRLAKAPVDATSVTRVTNQLPGDLPSHASGSPRWLRAATFVVGLGLIVAAVGLFGIVDPLSLLLVLVAGVLFLAVAAFMRSPQKKQSRGNHALESETRDILDAYGLDAPLTRGDFQSMAARLQDARREWDDLVSLRRDREQKEGEFRDAEERVRDVAARLGEEPSGDLGEVAERVARRLEESRAAWSQLKVTTQGLEKVDAQHAHAQEALAQCEKKLQGFMERTRAKDESALRGLLDASEKRDRLEGELEGVLESERRFHWFAGRFNEVLEELGEEPPPRERYPVVVGAVYHRAEEAHTMRASARVLDEKLRENRQEHKRVQEERTGLQVQLETILNAHDVAELAGLEALQETGRHLQGLEQQIRAQEGSLSALEANLPGVRDEADRVPPEEDQALLAKSEEAKEEHQKRMKGLREQIQELRSRLDRLDSSDRLGDLLAEYKAVQAELDEAREAWAELALTRFLLERARREYEDKHGPEVLQRASVFLSRLTNGRYERLVASPDGTGHQLVLRSGRRLPAMPPHVSRGLFAQAYLFVRLAYSDVMRKDAPLPYVLDDVLSDFDEPRLERAAGILNDLAENRQVVLFTHHGHVAKAIEAAGGRVVPLNGV